MSSMSLLTLEPKATSQESKDSSTKPYVKEKGGSQVPVAGGLFVATPRAKYLQIISEPSLFIIIFKSFQNLFFSGKKKR
jgi:hypothetical protein